MPRTTKKPAKRARPRTKGPVPTRNSAEFAHPDRFVTRHIGPRPDDVPAMLKVLGLSSLDELVDAVVPDDIRLRRPLQLPAARSEPETLDALRQLADRNQVFRSY